MSSYIIGVDIGTGSTKAVSINTSGQVLFSTSASYPTLSPKPGYSEQAPELIWQAFIKCIQQTVNKLGQPKGIALSSAMHSLIAVNENGDPYANMITWADNRSAAVAESIKHSAAGEMIYEQTGTPIHSMSPLCKIIWLKENEPELFAKTHKFISIKEFIWHKLFQLFEIDHSLASATGLFDIEKSEWNVNALTRAEIDSKKLSSPVSTGTIRNTLSPEVATQLKLETNTSFIIGASDGCMANLGSFATEPGIAALTIGTSGAIRVGNTKPTLNFNAMTFNYRLDEATFISGGPVNNGGATLKWFIQNFLSRNLNSPDDYNAILQEIESIEAGADGLLFLPYLLGERAPIWNSNAQGVFFGINSQHKQAHFTRAVIEGITMALYHVANAMEESGLTIKQIHVSGGFVRSKIWIQILSDIFNKKVCLINPEDASALGAAYMALKSLGLITNYDQIKPDAIETYLPDSRRHRIYASNFLRYKKVYNSLKEIMNED
ncbi:MAG TPA: gluconokinase [Cyclobacteriaceae bacterium]